VNLVCRGRKLRNRLSGIRPKIEYIGVNLGLTGLEWTAHCRHIDRLDTLNLAVQLEFLIDTANAVLQACSNKSEALNLGSC
jgi:hypothetical protein